jgi:hypothetical protein
MSARRARTPKEETSQGAQPEGHPTLQHLAAYHQGRLGESEEEEIREHFLLCRECREVLLDLAEFLDETPPPSRFSPEEALAAWLELERASS